MYVYKVGPIDEWDGWIQPDGGLGDRSECTSSLRADRAEYQALLNQAQTLAHRLAWEGDTLQGPFISMLPDPRSASSKMMIAWKQRNDGITFVASPFPLKHLEDYLHTQDQ